MEVRDTGFPGLCLIEPKVFRDPRGFFLETWSRPKCEASGLFFDFVQDNHAYSSSPGVLRGLHFQAPPAAQAKLVRVSRGAVLDVTVDLRRGSPTFGKWYAVELSAENFLMLLVPRGFAHAYLTLREHTEFLYKVDAPYAPQHDRGIVWDDPDLGIDWPVEKPILSDKDRLLPRFRDVDSPFVFEGS